MSLCSVGLYMNSKCNKLTYSRTVGVKHLESFGRDELELIFWRSGLTILNINAAICHHHEQTILKDFHLCRKPVLIRSKPIKKLLKVCSINTVYEF